MGRSRPDRPLPGFGRRRDAVRDRASKGPGSATRADFPGRGSFENAGAPPATAAFSAAVQKAVELVRAAGALSVFRLNWPPYLIPIHSTMRMGASEADSVLDAGAEARSVKRLFIADNSALPNGVAGVNPTLTTQALATRTAENIFRRYFGGDPWVSETAPVSSTDPAVTAAVVERRL